MSVAVPAPAARADLPVAACPYRGLVPFSERDAAYFFGRAAEREIIAANLMASPLTLLYAPSGVGKSSVLRAGVVHDLIERGRDSVRRGYGPEYVPAIVRDWRQDPLGALSRALEDGVRAVLGDAAVAVPVTATRPAAQIAAWAERADATMLVIFDQFEEFLLYHGEAWEDGDPAPELAAAMSASDGRASFLVALREDALASLDRFKGRVPGLFDNYLRLRQLDAEAGRMAIHGPVGEWNRRHPGDEMRVAPGLADTLLGGGPIAASFLQLVLTKLWEAERAGGSAWLRPETLAELGGADRIVATYLEDQMERLSQPERDVASAVFHQLVTPSGAKVARSLPDLSGYTGAAPDELRDVLGKLSHGDEWRILRPEPDPHGGPTSYEIFHDVLAEPVLDWRARHEADRAGRQALADAREQAHRRRRRLLVSASLAAVVLTALTVLAVLYLLSARAQEQEAERARVRAVSDALVTDSRIALASDPELSVLLAGEAIDRNPTTLAGKSALRAALGEDRSLGQLLRGGSRVTFLDASADGNLVLAATEDGRLRVWSVTDRHPLYTLRVDAFRPGTSFSPQSTRLVTSHARGAVVREASTGRRLVALKGSRNADRFRWSTDGRFVLGNEDTSAVVWDAHDGRVVQRVGIGRFLGARWAGPRRIVAAGYDGLALWQVGRRTPLRRTPVDGALFGYQVSRDGSMALLADSRSTRAWDLRTGHLRRLSAASLAPTSSLGLDAAGREAIAGGYDGRVRLWDTRTGEVRALFNGHASTISAVRLSANGRTAVTASTDRTARVWDVRTGVQLAVLGGHDAGINTFAMSEAGIVVTGDYTGVVRLWRIWPRPGAELADRGTALRAAGFSHDGTAVVASTGAGVRVWDAVNLAAPPLRLDAPAQTAELSPDGRSLLVAPGMQGAKGGRDARVLPASDGAPSGRPLALGIRDDAALSAAFSPDGRLIVTSQRDGAAWLWSARDHRLLHQLGPGGRPSAARELLDAAFSADSRLVVTGGATTRVRVFDARTGRPAGVFKVPDPSGRDIELGIFNVVRSVALQPHGALVAAGDDAGFVRLWDRRNSAVRRDLSIGAPVRDLAFSPDGALLATAAGGDAKLWDVSTGQPISVLTRGARTVRSVAFSRDGRRIVLTTGQAIHVLPCELCGSVRALRALAKDRVRRRLTPQERAIHLPKGER